MAEERIVYTVETTPGHGAAPGRDAHDFRTLKLARAWTAAHPAEATGLLRQRADLRTYPNGMQAWVMRPDKRYR